MSTEDREGFWPYVKESIVGVNVGIETPFGHRHLSYCDYTASGRLVDFIEEYLKETLRLYGNTHTEDDATGCITTRSLQQAEQTIKNLVGAGRQYRIIEALQPHASYEFDDGFQPLGIISTLRFDDEAGAEEALAEFSGRQPPVMSIVAEFIEKGIIIQTPFEPWNGDVMLGLREFLPRRRAAHDERKRLIEELAAKYNHRAGWNEDGPM